MTWSLVKPTAGRMVIGGNLVEKEFYQENEWRYVPSDGVFLYQSKFDKEKDKANKKLESAALEISPSDIKYIFVKADSEIPRMVDFINNNLGGFPLNDVKILQSRIVSLETLNSDL